jgi:hypothetical protein
MTTRIGVTWSGVINLFVCLFVLLSGVREARAGSDAPSSAAPTLHSEGTQGRDSSYVTLHLLPESVQIGFFFNEGKVSVTGTLPTGCDAVLIVQGPKQEREMRVQGKKVGLWMSVGTAAFKNVPSFYKCLTSGAASEIMSRETAIAEGAGFQRVKEGMDVAVESGGVEQEAGEDGWKDEFVAFQKSRGLFYLGESDLELEDGEDGLMKVSGEIAIPARSPVGSYQVVLVALKEGVPVARVEETLSVDLMPSVAFLRRLAMEHGWTYGIVAVIVALGAGLGVGAITPSKGGAH